MDAVRQSEIDGICDNIRAWLESADLDVVRTIRYATLGMTQPTLRDIRWVLGRKAGRIHCQMAEG